MATLVEETTDLLQHLIRNECVNDGTPASGHEIKSVETLESYLRTPGIEMQRYEPMPGRGSLVLRIEGTDKTHTWIVDPLACTSWATPTSFR